MTYPLHDFRIENENLILLSFANGTTARVRRGDLADYLSKRDLAKVTKAMSVRHTFIKRILPPTALVLLSASILALGTHDARQLMNRLQPSQPTTKERPLEAQPEPASAVQTMTAPEAASSPAVAGPAALPVGAAGSPVVSPVPAALVLANDDSQVTKHSRVSGKKMPQENNSGTSRSGLLQSLPRDLTSLLKSN